MKKLLLTLISVTLLFSCGENEKDVKIKELEKKIKEFEENEEDNVLKEEIALKEVNLGIVRIISSLEKRNNETYHAFDNATNQEKVKPYRDLVYQIKPEADELIDFIQGMKNEEVYNSGEATQLRNDINDYKEFLLNILETSKDEGLVSDNGYLSSLIEELNTTLDIKDGEIYEEDDISDLVDLTLLSKWQADIRNMESAVISFLSANIDASSLKFTGSEATTIPASSLILKNEEFQSKIFLTAFDESSTPTIFVFEDGKGDYEILEDGTCKITGVYDSIPVENGKGTYTVKGSSVGPQPYKGFIKILQDEGYEYYPFNGEYVVANSSYAISPTKMNVMYHNKIENPISISVAGYLPEDVTVRCSGGKISPVNKKKGEYEVVVTANDPSKVKIYLSVRTDNGIKKIGFEEFRIKYAIGNVTRARRGDGEYSKNEIKSNVFWSSIPDFDFPVDFYVSSFEVVTIGTQKVTTKVSGNKVNSVAKREIDKLESGQTVVFQNFLVRQVGMENNKELLKDKYVLTIK